MPDMNFVSPLDGGSNGDTKFRVPAAVERVGET